MEQLRAPSLDQSANFMRVHARPIDYKRFEYHFGDGDLADIMAELAKYQNADGGFGHALEPDVRLPASSPFVTSVGFQLLRELDASAAEPLVRDGIAFLLAKYDSELAGWRTFGEDVADYPRAPWWEFQTVAHGLKDEAWGNPRAELTGYLHRYSTLVPPGILSHTLDLTLASLDAMPDDMEIHTMMCFMRAAEMIPNGASSRIKEKLIRGVHAVISTDDQGWSSYGGRPLGFATTPHGFLAVELNESASRELDYLISTQHPDGYWEPSWRWGRYEDVWEVAKVEWRGVLTMQNLLSLKAWGRIEGYAA